MKRIIYAAMIMTLFVTAGCMKGNGQKAPEKAIEVKPVKTEMVKSEQIEEILQVSGDLKGENEVAISPKVGGRIKEVRVDIGDEVKKFDPKYKGGTILAIIESADYDAGVGQAAAAVAGAQARVAMVLKGARPEEKQQVANMVAQAEAGVAAAKERYQMARTGARTQERQQMENMAVQARQGYDLAKKSLDRMKQLLDAGVASQQQYDSVRLQYDMADAQLKNARQQLSMVEEGARKEELEMARQGVVQAEAALRSARDQQKLVQEGARAEEKQMAREGLKQAQSALALANNMRKETVIRSPMDGVVASRYFDPGALVGPGLPYPLMTIVANNAFDMVAEIAETDLARIEPGQTVEITVDAFPSLKFYGTVKDVNPTATQGTRTYSVKIIIDGKKNKITDIKKLKSGLHARGIIHVTKNRNKALTVSMNDLVGIRQTSNNETIANLYAVVNDPRDKSNSRKIARKLTVKIGIVNPITDRVEILSTKSEDASISRGLAVGDSVIIGAGGMNDGDPVNVVNNTNNN